MKLVCTIVATLVAFTAGKEPVNILIVTEEMDSSINGLVNDAISTAERDFGNGVLSVHVSVVEILRDNENESYQRVCAALYKGVSLILDMTWTGWNKLRTVASDSAIVYKRGDATLTSYVQVIDDYLTLKNATDAALIFENEKVIDELTEASTVKIRAMRPSPSYYVIFASTSNMDVMLKAALEGGLVKRDRTWSLVFTDFNYKDFRYISGEPELNVSISLMTMKNDVCCRLIGESPCSCPNDFQAFPYYFKRLVGLLVDLLSEVQKSGISIEPRIVNCRDENASAITDNITVQAFDKNLLTRMKSDNGFEYIAEQSLIVYPVEIELKRFNRGSLVKIAEWNRSDKMTIMPKEEIKAARRFFRVGTMQAIPWSYAKTDPETGQPMRDESGNEIWEGYCIDLIWKLSEDMDFDFELVIPEDRSFGSRKPNGRWTGLVGDLARGETDIAISALTMTSEREEVIDFVAPYFEQSGILIVIRKPLRKTSLFKFMTVLRLEVWLSIVGALTVTGIMIWILDKYSPYSARNNKKLYPYPCREFTLKESFWFALTSFTPQGGGEAPKALSGRTLVAAYWLFVVLMLATFTANLAAFLTVERMQSPVQSLEQLARQSRINYTVLANSTIHQYFINMKNAEDKLYSVWKEITLNSTSEQIEYRVWDYPIKEQYGHILQAITQAGPVETQEEGFKKVVDSENAEFAFIHDSSEIKYEVTKNCNLTVVGEVFAEQPYAIAVQQGSHLQEEISKRILDLQKDRYFETLASKYWNQSSKGACRNADDSEGITLESLGGVFIATLFGLVLAMITLAGEVIYYRKRNVKRKAQKKIVEPRNPRNLQIKPAPTVSISGGTFNMQPRVSHISVYPKNFPFKD